jgi:hypothetical protein
MRYEPSKDLILTLTGDDADPVCALSGGGFHVPNQAGGQYVTRFMSG